MSHAARTKSNLEILLSEWGSMKAGENRSGLGLPSQSAFSRMRVDCDRHGGANTLMGDDDVRRIDRAIQYLHPDTRLVVTAHYVWPGVVKAKLYRLRIARTSYYETLEFAHKQLSHSMGGEYADCFPTILSGHLEAVSG